MAVPYVFANATSAIPLSQLDSNFATAVTIGNVAIQLGNTATTLSNLSLGNVTISSSSISNVSVGGTANAVVYANTTNILSTNANFTFDGTNVQIANSLKSANTFGFKNRLIDAGFIINQRGYVSGTSLSSGSYGHDRWKGGASGGTYTFTQGSTGVPIVITITSGAIQQVIEGCNVPEGGTYVLSWVGTATASINGGSSGSSPLTVTGATAGANMTIQFNTGTVSYPQLETGTQATSFDLRDYGTELILCYRYYEKMYEPCGVGRCNNTPSARFFARFTVLKRTTPTITGTGSFAVSDLYTTDAVQTANQGINGSTAITTSGFSFSILCSTLDNSTPFVPGSFAANLANTGVLTGSAEL